MRIGKSFELRYIFVKIYRENRYILTGTFRYIFGIGIGTETRLVSVVRYNYRKCTEVFGLVLACMYVRHTGMAKTQKVLTSQNTKSCLSLPLS